MINLESVSSSKSWRVRNLHDKAKEYIALLQGITLDEFIIILIKSKLDTELQTKYEEQRPENDTLKGFFAFLNQRCRILESHEPSHFKRDFNKDSNKDFNKDKKFQQTNSQSGNQNCPCCNDKHVIFFCSKFRSLEVNERKDLVKQESLCLLCLRANHTVSTCTFKKMCSTCGKKQNGLLHFDDQADGKKNDETKSSKRAYTAVMEQNQNETQEQVTDQVACAAVNKDDVLLATALVRIKIGNKWSEPVRALIDQGSTGSFCSEKLVKNLGYQFS